MTKYLETEERWIAVADDSDNWRVRQYDHPKEMSNLKARVALDLVQRFGLIGAMPNGEDSTGRSKLQLMPVTEVVDRAVTIADMIVDELREREWFDKMPHPTEIYDTPDSQS